MKSRSLGQRASAAVAAASACSHFCSLRSERACCNACAWSPGGAAATRKSDEGALTHIELCRGPLAFELDHGLRHDPALWRLESKQLIEAEWGLSENNRKAKFYRLTAAGRKHLTQEHSKWAEFVEAVTNVMGPVPVP